MKTTIQIILIIGGIYLTAYSIEQPNWIDHANAIIGGVLIFVGVMWLLANIAKKHFDS